MALFAIPFALKAIGAVCVAAGLANAKSGYDKRCKAEKKVKKAHKRHNQNVARFNAAKDSAVRTMDEMGQLELQIIASFKDFIRVMEYIQNPPKFKAIIGNAVELPELTLANIKDVSVGANTLLGGLGGVAAGTFAAFAASGAVTSATAALGTTAAGVAISGLHGIAATNAVLATLGGGTLAAGGGGVAAGAAVLNFATFGLGILIGGIIFNCTADEYVERADEVFTEMLQNERKIFEICDFLDELHQRGNRYTNVLQRLNAKYRETLAEADELIRRRGVIDYALLTHAEQTLVKDLSLLVGWLYSLCKVRFVLQSDEKEGVNEVNRREIDEAVEQVGKAYSERYGSN